MKKILTLILLTIVFASCSSDDEDETNKKEQELWLNGYTQWVSGGEVKSDIVRLLFFSANNNEEFEINNYPSGVTEYYEYMKLEEDKINIYSIAG